MSTPAPEARYSRKRPYAEHRKALRLVYATANSITGPFELRDLLRFAQEDIPSLTYTQAVRAAQTLLADGCVRVVDRIRYSRPDRAATLYEFVDEFRNVSFNHRGNGGRRRQTHLETVVNRRRLSDGESTYVRLADADTTELVYLLYRKVYRIRSPQVVIGIARGVYIPLRKWVDFCRLDGIPCEDDTMLIQSYTGPHSRKEPRLVYGHRIDIAGREVLLLDDVADTGESLMLARDHLLRYSPKKVLTAALFQKAKSRFAPDYSCARIGDEWVIFLGEEHEDGVAMYRKWLANKVPHHEIISRFDALGYSGLEMGRIERAVQCTAEKTA